MTNLVASTFATRRDAELVVERLVQTHGMERDAIQVAPEGEANTVGDRPSGGDFEGDSHSIDSRSDVPIAGRVKVVVSAETDDEEQTIRTAFVEFGAKDG
ncbi:hypothetical protein [Brevundimonas sp. 'scallop']|uniref:hypothetical protein n=1 Tax=Brevundimonas sp. 'scallop' TaxID=2562582 RepID=UPI0013E132E5|nr:hypothetical protein [Brevundimonas sp. 'scallop']QIF82411.1 hypothetical protein E4341_12280 [Brevundimonas sp. 'scallop']